MKSVLITGSSKGIGKAAAELFAKKGWKVYATVRSLPKYPQKLFSDKNISVIKMDVTDNKDVQDVFKNFSDKNVKLDAVINNAGYGLYGPFERIPLSEIINVYQTNVFGLMRVTHESIGHMKQTGGTIVNISSIGGRTNIPYYSAYGSTKAAIESFTEGLQIEIDNYGIRLKIVEPGGVDTGFYDKAKGLVPADGEAKKNETKAEKVTRMFSFSQSPESVAKVIYKATKSKSKRLRYTTSVWVGSFLLARRFLPDRLYQIFMKLAFN